MKRALLAMVAVWALGVGAAWAATSDTEVSDDTGGGGGYPSSDIAGEKGGCDCMMASGAAAWLLAPLALGVMRRRREP